MAIGVTPKQLSLLRFIAGYQAAHGGISPTMRECGVALGMGKSGVFRLLSLLEERGAVRRLHGRERAIELIKYVPFPQIGGAPLFAVPRAPASRVAYSRETL